MGRTTESGSYPKGYATTRGLRRMRLPELELVSRVWLRMRKEEHNLILDAYESDGGWGTRQEVKDRIYAYINRHMIRERSN